MKTNMDKANAAYNKFLKEFGWEETSPVALAKFGYLINFSFLEMMKQKKAKIPEDEIRPYSEYGAGLIDSINGDHGDLVLKMIRAKYMSGLGGYYFNFRAYLMLVWINTLIFILDKLGFNP